MTGKMLIKAANLWDGRQEETLPEAFVAVEQGRITALGRQIELGSYSELEQGAVVLDLGQGSVLPGLINMHTHLTLSASDTVLADYFKEQAAGLPTLTLRAVDNMRRSLAAGVTTIRDCGTLNEVVLPVRAAVENGWLAGPRVVASGHGITTTGGHCYYFGIEADTADEVRKAVRAQAKAGVDFIKVFATGGGLTPGTNSVAAQYTEQELCAATEEARRLGKKVASHAHGTAGVRNSIAAKVDTLEHCTFMTTGGVQYEPELAEAIARQGMYVVPTLNMALSRRLENNPNLLRHNPSLAGFNAISAERHRNFRRLYDAGVIFASGSDSGIPGCAFEDFPSDLALLVQEIGLSPYQALLTATSIAAKACGLADTGVLEPGKRADVLGVAGNPLEDIRALQQTQLVSVAGRLAVWNRLNEAGSGGAGYPLGALQGV